MEDWTSVEGVVCFPPASLLLGNEEMLVEGEVEIDRPWELGGRSGGGGGSASGILEEGLRMKGGIGLTFMKSPQWGQGPCSQHST